MVWLRLKSIRGQSRAACLLFACGLFSGASLASPLSPELMSVSTNRFMPATVRVFWDTSATQETYETPALSFLTALIDEVRPSSLELVPFGTGVNPDDRIDMRAEADELEYFVRQLGYAGETDIEALYRAESQRPSRDACFLVSDGQFTPGRSPSAHLPCQLYVISASPEADTVRLALLARQGGGQYINLAELNFDEARERLSTEKSHSGMLTREGYDTLQSAQGQTADNHPAESI